MVVMGEWLQPFSPSYSSSFYLEVPSYENLISYYIISTEGALRRPMTYDNHPINPSNPTHIEDNLS